MYGYEIRTTKGAFSTKTVIFAPGLLAAPKTGSDGSAFPYIEALGHHFVDVVPALMQLHGKQAFFKKLAGIRRNAGNTLPGKCAISTKRQPWDSPGENTHAVCSERGELQLTASGISGIPVFQISRYATRALADEKHPYVLIDFAPDLTDKEFFDLLSERFYENTHGKSAGEALIGLFNRKLSEVLLRSWHTVGTLCRGGGTRHVAPAGEVCQEFPLILPEATEWKRRRYAQGR